jgi:transposase
VYLEIGEKAAHLRELGMSDRAIARALGVSDKTARKAISSLADGAGQPGEP